MAARSSVSKKSERYGVIPNQWCSAQRIKIVMIASGNHTIIHAVSCVPRKHETEGIRTIMF